MGTVRALVKKGKRDDHEGVKLRPVVALGINCPGIFDNKKGDPLIHIALKEEVTANKKRDGIDDLKGDTITMFVACRFLVVGNI